MNVLKKRRHHLRKKRGFSLRHCYLSPSVFKGVFGLEMCANLRHHYLPFSSFLKKELKAKKITLTNFFYQRGGGDFF